MVCLSSQSRSTRSAASCGMPPQLLVWETMHRLEKAGLVFPAVPVISPSLGYWVYNADTIRNLQRPNRDNKPRLESSQQRTNGQSHTIGLARFCCYPPALYTRPTSRCFVPQSGLSYTHTPHAHTSSTLARRSRYRLHSSFPSTRHSLQRTNPLFYIQSPP